MQQFSRYKSVYFIGIGGIGMSALARYFKHQGFSVGGYDKTPSPLTSQLEQEGCEIHFEDLGDAVPVSYSDASTTLVVYTPAIKQLGELSYFRKNAFTLLKRAEVLGMLTRQSKGLCVAGTHGKTTTSSMLAFLLDQSSWKCNAFLGGIATNLQSNLVLNQESEYTVIEADEFDRSFLHLSPFATIITAADPDHLDIYGTADQFKEGFRQFAMKLDPNGICMQKEGLNLPTLGNTFTYAVDSKTADYEVTRFTWVDGFLCADVRLKNTWWREVQFGLPGVHNAENALACIGLLHELGMDEQVIRQGLKNFQGVKRRFEYIIRSEKLVYVDDYAHHPAEIKALVHSIRLLYPEMKITGVFQPHLFSRTKDFAEDFAHELSTLDELILLPIYPAREEPILGVSSEWLLSKCNLRQKSIKKPSELLPYLSEYNQGVLLTIGAGDIDRLVLPLKELLTINLTD
ncbi:MAG: UDP-N-acetylmuramate--L-alanine ligase [Crocinitomicaceae bacterium]